MNNFKINIPDILDDSNTIFFWNIGDTSHIHEGCFSQWWPCNFQDASGWFTSAEQYMMAMKASLFSDNDVLRRIKGETNPAVIKRLGRMVQGFDSKVWNDNRYTIVVNANDLKFSQNESLKQYLLSTGDKVLVEASPYDHIWGIGLNKTDERRFDQKQWKGQNLLGFALMNVRTQIRQQGKI